jgi:hypothetical protein
VPPLPVGPYPMLGPVQVADADPSDVIEAGITARRTIGWAWSSFPLAVWALPHDFAGPCLQDVTFGDALDHGGVHRCHHAAGACMPQGWAVDGRIGRGVPAAAGVCAGLGTCPPQD